MNRLKQLLTKLCPNGVRYVNIGSIVYYEQPSKYIVKSTSYSDNFEIPVLTAGQSFILGYTNEIENLYNASKENPVIIFDDFTAAFKWVDFPFKVKSSAIKILKAKSEETTLRYIFHIMGRINYFSNEHKRLWISIYSKISIPLPPLPVQEEIVRILDKFTELNAELNAELNDRKQQYEYYRNKLLTFGDEVEYKPLGEISNIFLGLTYTPTYVDSGVKFISAQNTSRDFLDLTNVKYITEEEYKNSTSNAKPKKGDILFTRVGSNLGHPVIVDTEEELCIFVSLGFIRVDSDKVLNSYINHWMKTDLFWSQVKKNVHGSAKVNLNTGWLKNFDVPIPSLKEQKRIVTILDKFDTLTNSISEGLPREIELHQTRYEYYRDKLLTFKKLEKMD